MERLRQIITCQSAIVFTLLVFSTSVHAKVIGEVKFVKGESNFKRGEQVTSKKTYRTGADGIAIIKLNSGDTVKVNESSEINFKNEQFADLKKGSSFFSIVKRAVDNSLKKAPLSFKVNAAAASMGVRGTVFFVSHGVQHNDAWICVNEGVVEVKNAKAKSKTVSVKAGEGVTVHGKHSPSTPKFLPWTSELNWEFDSEKEIVNKVKIEEAYTDILNEEY